MEVTRDELVETVEKLVAVAHAHQERITTLEEALAARERVSEEGARERILRLLDWLPGVPLTSFDVAEVLGITTVYAQQRLLELARKGRVRRWRDPDAVTEHTWLYSGIEEEERAA